MVPSHWRVNGYSSVLLINGLGDARRVGAGKREMSTILGKMNQLPRHHFPPSLLGGLKLFVEGLVEIV